MPTPPTTQNQPKVRMGSRERNIDKSSVAKRRYAFRMNRTGALDEGSRALARDDALLHALEIVVLELVHQLIQRAAIVPIDPVRVQAHVTEEGAGAPDLPLED